MKSPSFMSNGRFNTSKCRGKLQKMGVLCTHFSKMPGPSPHFHKKVINKIIINNKIPKLLECQTNRATARCPKLTV
jgi:hypothetical protein